MRRYRLPALFGSRFSPLRFTLLALFCLTLQAAAQRRSSALTRKYPPRALQEDALLFSNVCLAMHPAVGIYEPRSYYEKLFAEFVASLTDSLTEKQFRLRLKLVADELHCGHTEVLYSAAYYREVTRLKQNYSPYIFVPVGQKVYMFANLNSSRDTLIKKGEVVTRINGVPVDSMLRYAKRFVSSDGYNSTAREHYIQLAFNSYYTGLFGRPDTFNIEYTDGKSVKSARYAASRQKSVPSVQIGPKPDSLLHSYRRAGIAYRFLDAEKNTMLLRISKFATVGEKRAYRRVFAKMRKSRAQNLVIDIRNNGGGSLLNTYRLLSYIIDAPVTQTLRTRVRHYPYKRYTRGDVWFRFTRFVYGLAGTKKSQHDTELFIYRIKPAKRNHFGGKIFVLINGGSFSASSLLAAYLKDTGRATFIGEETGGTMEGCNAGVTPYYKLPNTKLRVRIPAFRIVHDVSPRITGQGVMPDYHVQYTFADIVARRDLELQKVKELLRIP